MAIIYGRLKSYETLGDLRGQEWRRWEVTTGAYSCRVRGKKLQTSRPLKYKIPDFSIVVGIHFKRALCSGETLQKESIHQRECAVCVAY